MTLDASINHTIQTVLRNLLVIPGDKIIFGCWRSSYYDAYAHIYDPIANLILDVVDSSIDDITKHIINKFI